MDISMKSIRTIQQAIQTNSWNLSNKKDQKQQVKSINLKTILQSLFHPAFSTKTILNILTITPTMDTFFHSQFFVRET